MRIWLMSLMLAGAAGMPPAVAETPNAAGAHGTPGRRLWKCLRRAARGEPALAERLSSWGIAGAAGAPSTPAAGAKPRRGRKEGRHQNQERGRNV